MPGYNAAPWDDDYTIEVGPRPSGYQQNQMLADILKDKRSQQNNGPSFPSISPSSVGDFSSFGGGGSEAYMDGYGGVTGPGASGGTGMSNFAGGATPLLWAYLIGKGKMIENQNPNSPVGKGLLAGLGPSFAQIKEDPKGMGLPTLAGLPFLTPWTGSKKARETEPEWAGFWKGIGL